MSKKEINLHETIDASIWADEFIKRVKKNPSIATDNGSMIGWFANAIMAGYDKGIEVGKREVSL